ncbi:MAG: cupin domain-containing protein [Pseudomonadota bacterium]
MSTADESAGAPPGARFDSSAPHISGVSTWDGPLTDWGGHLEPIDGRSRNSGRLLWKGANGLPEAGLWICTPGSWRLTLPRDEMCHFLAGCAIYRSDDGEEIEVRPGMVVHFREDWAGTVEVFETIRSVYMLR